MSISAGPLVSIVLPTYNRARFLDEAFASIASQTYPHWELVVVDDGSTDDTPAVTSRLEERCPRPVTVIRQANKGAYGARNTGLDRARGEFVAFFDSDDLWLPHHLDRCVAALVAHPSVDWAYGACRIVEMETGRLRDESTFHPGGTGRPFLSLSGRQAGPLHLIEDPGALECQIRHGLYCGLQNSVIRRRVFEPERFWPDYAVVEDVLFVIRLLARGGVFAYIDDPHVVYRVHDDNSSGAASNHGPAQALKIFGELLRGLERVRAEVPLPSPAARALDERIARERFWGLGYSGRWQSGDGPGALSEYRHALRVWPRDPRMWKTFVLAWARVHLLGQRR